MENTNLVATQKNTSDEALIKHHNPIHVTKVVQHVWHLDVKDVMYFLIRVKSRSNEPIVPR